MANNDEYTDEYNDEYLCRDFFVGFNFWSRLSFQISEFRVHWPKPVSAILLVSATYVILQKITSAIRDQSENREHKFTTLQKHEDRHLV